VVEGIIHILLFGHCPQGLIRIVSYAGIYEM
jgi:hypothetical protein